MLTQHRDFYFKNMNLNVNKFKKAHKIIRGAENILLITHNRPDGDALSSACAFSLLLERMGKKNKIFCSDPPPEIFSFLPGVEKIDSNKIEIQKKFKTFDLIIILDCGSITRTGLVTELETREDSQYVLELDHHPCQEGFSNLELRYPEMNSTTEVIYHFFKFNFLNLNKDIAECILTGILTDTANFLHPLTNNQTLKIASQMLNHGANFPKINKNTWQNKSVDSMKLWSVVLNNLNVNPKYEIAFSVLTREEMELFKENLEALDSILHWITNIEGVKALIFLKEEDKGKIKGNLRTNHSKINVSHLANHLGGGGHSKASGFALEGKIKKGENRWFVV